MSLLGIFTTGVTGINAQAQKLGAISDNISNANTDGYKPTDVEFQTLVTQTDAPTIPGSTGPEPVNYAPGGVIPTPRQLVSLQGLLTSTASNTDIAISGNGFFPVTAESSISGSGTSATLDQGATLAVTRAGSFIMDANGLLTNSAGYTLLGTPIGSTLPTSLNGLVPVALDPGPTVTVAGSATSEVSVAANLPATATAGSTSQLTVGVYDSAGSEYSLGITFTNTGTNTWTAAATSLTPLNSASGVTTTVSSTPTTLSFNSNGQLTSTSNGLSLGTFTLSNGASLSPTFNFGGSTGSNAAAGLTQFGSTFANGDTQQIGGAGAGYRTGIAITGTGVVQEIYSNGETIPRYQLPVVTYINPQGLEPESGNVWIATQQSGKAALNLPNTGGAGQIMPSELEQSSVDLSTEFENMIVSEATYQANTKTITTANQMWQTLTDLR
jgi:flagellar hook protein FlgE